MDSASVTPSTSTSTWRELWTMSIRWNGSRGCATLRSSSSYQASNASNSSSTYPSSAGSDGRNAAASAPPARAVNGCPVVVWTANGMLGSSTGRSPSCGAPMAGMPAGSSIRSSEATSSAATSAAGTA